MLREPSVRTSRNPARPVCGMFSPGAANPARSGEEKASPAWRESHAGLALPALRSGAGGTAGECSGLSCADALLDALADVLVDVLPVLEGALQDRLGHAAQQVADDVGDQPVPRGVVVDLAHQRAGL